jgi:hypothetical protein
MRAAIAAGLVAVAGLAIALAAGTLGALTLLIVPPLVASGFASPRATAAVALVAIVLVALAGLPHDEFDAAHVAALLAVLVAGVVAVGLSWQRAGRARSVEFSAFLGEAAALLACSLDFDETAKASASLPVPVLADWSLVEVFAHDGTVERRAASHADQGAETLAAALAAAADEPGRSRSELWADLPDDLLAAWAAGDEKRLGLLRSAGARSAVRVPLRSIERRLGVMTLLTTDSDRRFEAAELHRAEELASRCAVAIENAQLYRAARRGERRFARRAEPPAGGRVDPRSAE